MTEIFGTIASFKLRIAIDHTTRPTWTCPSCGCENIGRNTEICGMCDAKNPKYANVDSSFHMVSPVVDTMRVKLLSAKEVHRGLTNHFPHFKKYSKAQFRKNNSNNSNSNNNNNSKSHSRRRYDNTKSDGTVKTSVIRLKSASKPDSHTLTATKNRGGIYGYGQSGPRSKIKSSGRDRASTVSDVSDVLWTPSLYGDHISNMNMNMNMNMGLNNNNGNGFSHSSSDLMDQEIYSHFNEDNRNLAKSMQNSQNTNTARRFKFSAADTRKYRRKKEKIRHHNIRNDRSRANTTAYGNNDRPKHRSRTPKARSIRRLQSVDTDGRSFSPRFTIAPPVDYKDYDEKSSNIEFDLDSGAIASPRRFPEPGDVNSGANGHPVYSNDNGLSPPQEAANIVAATFTNVAQAAARAEAEAQAQQKHKNTDNLRMKSPIETLIKPSATDEASQKQSDSEVVNSGGNIATLTPTTDGNNNNNNNGMNVLNKLDLALLPVNNVSSGNGIDNLENKVEQEDDDEKVGTIDNVSFLEMMQNLDEYYDLNSSYYDSVTTSGIGNDNINNNGNNNNLGSSNMNDPYGMSNTTDELSEIESNDAEFIGPLLIPVIHVSSPSKKLTRMKSVFRNIDLVVKYNYDGIFLINHGFSYQSMVAVIKQVRKRYPNLFVGCNFLGLQGSSNYTSYSDPSLDIFKFLNKNKILDSVNAIWVEKSGIEFDSSELKKLMSNVHSHSTFNDSIKSGSGRRNSKKFGTYTRGMLSKTKSLRSNGSVKNIFSLEIAREDSNNEQDKNNNNNNGKKGEKSSKAQGWGKKSGHKNKKTSKQSKNKKNKKRGSGSNKNNNKNSKSNNSEHPPMQRSKSLRDVPSPDGDASDSDGNASPDSTTSNNSNGNGNNGRRKSSSHGASKSSHFDTVLNRPASPVIRQRSPSRTRKHRRRDSLKKAKLLSGELLSKGFHGELEAIARIGQIRKYGFSGLLFGGVDLKSDHLVPVPSSDISHARQSSRTHGKSSSYGLGAIAREATKSDSKSKRKIKPQTTKASRSRSGSRKKSRGGHRPKHKKRPNRKLGGRSRNRGRRSSVGLKRSRSKSEAKGLFDSTTDGDGNSTASSTSRSRNRDRKNKKGNGAGIGKSSQRPRDKDKLGSKIVEKKKHHQKRSFFGKKSKTPDNKKKNLALKQAKSMVNTPTGDDIGNSNRNNGKDGKHTLQAHTPVHISARSVGHSNDDDQMSSDSGNQSRSAHSAHSVHSAQSAHSLHSVNTDDGSGDEFDVHSAYSDGGLVMDFDEDTDLANIDPIPIENGNTTVNNMNNMNNINNVGDVNRSFSAPRQRNATLPTSDENGLGISIMATKPSIANALSTPASITTPTGGSTATTDTTESSKQLDTTMMFELGLPIINSTKSTDHGHGGGLEYKSNDMNNNNEFGNSGKKNSTTTTLIGHPQSMSSAHTNSANTNSSDDEGQLMVVNNEMLDANSSFNDNEIDNENDDCDNVKKVVSFNNGKRNSESAHSDFGANSNSKLKSRVHISKLELSGINSNNSNQSSHSNTEFTALKGSASASPSMQSMSQSTHSVGHNYNYHSGNSNKLNVSSKSYRSQANSAAKSFENLDDKEQKALKTYYDGLSELGGIASNGLMHVVTTSGKCEDDLQLKVKFKALRDSTFNRSLLAVASGVDIYNVEKYLPFVDCIMISNGISKDFHNFDENKMKKLKEKINNYYNTKRSVIMRNRMKKYAKIKRQRSFEKLQQQQKQLHTLTTGDSNSVQDDSSIKQSSLHSLHSLHSLSSNGNANGNGNTNDAIQSSPSESMRRFRVRNVQNFTKMESAVKINTIKSSVDVNSNNNINGVGNGNSIHVDDQMD